MKSDRSFRDTYSSGAEGFNDTSGEDTPSVFADPVEHYIVKGMAIFLIALLLFGYPFSRGGNNTPEMSESRRPDIEVVTAFREQVLQSNSDLPVMINKETRLDRIEAVSGAKFIHHHTLLIWWWEDVRDLLLWIPFVDRTRVMTA